MSDEAARQAIVDEEHLKLLSLGYFVSGGVSALFSLFGLLYVLMAIFMDFAVSHAPQAADKARELPPALFGWMLGGFGALFFLAFISMALARFWVGLSIRRRKSRTFCLVVAGIGCLEFPYGTLLGVLTFIVLGRDSVARVFSSAVPAPAARVT